MHGKVYLRESEYNLTYIRVIKVSTILEHVSFSLKNPKNFQKQTIKSTQTEQNISTIL